MCHVWNIASVDVFVFITEVLITKYKSQTQKYKLWIKWVCVIQLSLHLLNFVVSFRRCCYCRGLVYKTTVSCFPQFLNWRVSYHFPEQGSCYRMCQQMWLSLYQVTVHGEIIIETFYIHFFFFCTRAIALVSVGSQFCKFCLPFQ